MNKGSSISSNRSEISISERVDVKRIRSNNSNLFTRQSVKKPEDIIVCENQEELYCGRHALRPLSQRLDLFSDDYLIEVAQNVAAAEQICRHGEPIRLAEYYYQNTGEYDIQVLKAAVMNIFNIDLIQIHTLEADTSSVQGLILCNIENVQVLLIQQDYHYYCLRRFRLTKDYFFIIDSQHPFHHEPIHRQNILNFLGTLLEGGASIYVAIQYISDRPEDQASIDNIETRLWALPDAPADGERLAVFCEIK